MAPPKTSPVPGKNPEVLEIPTLGYNARLGELYDERKGSFIDVLLYEQSAIDGESATVKQDVPHTDLILTMANSFEDKASLFDIDARLSVEILSGLISVSGSASYIRDTASNTMAKSWAMSLKMRLLERRLLFAEENLGRKVPTLVLNDYIAKDRATHFVSAVTYGGNVIVNLVERRSETDDEEIIEGSMNVQLQKLKGVVDLKGEASVEIKDKFKNLDNKLDLTFHGDVDLTPVPVNAQDLLDALPDSSALIKDGGGVPISVVLQPIPAALRDHALHVYHIDQQILVRVLNAFANLDDVRSRFTVLQQGIKSFSKHVPKLSAAIHTHATAFDAEHNKFLAALRDFVEKFQSGSATDVDLTFVETAEELYNEQVQAMDQYQAPVYPDNLAGLERAFADFFDLATGIERIGFNLNTLDEVVRSVLTLQSIPLFLMPPLNTSAGLLLAQCFSLVRARANPYANKNPPIPFFIFYAEDTKELERQLPNDGRFADLKGAALYLGEKDKVGNLTWRLDPPAPDASNSEVFSVNVNRRCFSPNGVTIITTPLDKIDSSGSFTILAQADAEAKSTPSTREPYGVILQLVDVGSQLRVTLCAAPHIRAFIWSGSSGTSLTDDTTEVSIGKPFWLALVRDMDAERYLFYVDDKKIGEKPVETEWKSLLILEQYPNFNYLWNGTISKIRAYSEALTEEQIARACQS